MHGFSSAADVDLCSFDEVMVASCHLDDGKSGIVSFCASTSEQIITFRSGSVSNKGSSVVFSEINPISRWVDAATYTVYLGFRLGRYSYVFGVPQETLGAKAFLDVVEDGEDLITEKCTDNSFGQKRLANGAIQEVEDEFVRGNEFMFPP